jgi:hypothetical protein
MREAAHDIGKAGRVGERGEEALQGLSPAAFGVRPRRRPR